MELDLPIQSVLALNSEEELISRILTWRGNELGEEGLIVFLPPQRSIERILQLSQVPVEAEGNNSLLEPKLLLSELHLRLQDRTLRVSTPHLEGTILLRPPISSNINSNSIIKEFFLLIQLQIQ